MFFAVNSAFAKTFRSGIQPVEIASALRSELDKKAAVVSRDRILTPHTFTVRLAPSDDERMRAIGPALGEELQSLVQKHARAQGYSFAGPVNITLERDDQPVWHHGKVAKGVNPWRYVVGQSVVNNIGKYDLWAEIVVGDEVLVISNWRKETFSREQLSRYYKKKKRN